MKFLTIVLYGLIIVSCTSQKTQKTQKVIDPNTLGLTEGQAKIRYKMVKKVDYKLWIELFKKQKYFKGDININFFLAHKDQPLRIDFEGGKIKNVVVNNTKIESIRYDGFKLLIDPEYLEIGETTIKISYEREYSKTGAGLHYFKDPVDERAYVYSDFEPYDANKLFPCFDQPDLRANYQLNVIAPKNWKVITYSYPKKVMEKGTKKYWRFGRSENFSTYIFSLHAGPYKEWKSKSAKYPMRLYARKSVAKFVDHKEWFLITKQGFKYFEDYFGQPYPYAKYDQVLVPDFNSGAMENVAAVTFNERFAFRTRPTVNQRESRANTILHEMAHMWFGNLVTMKWWNGLWLNESFATFMAYKALNKATQFKKAWTSFYTGTKQWAYWQDQLVTTHPIELEVNNTSSAFANFDGITYGKGASVLKQLNYYLSDDIFKKGIQDYFKRFKNRNTTLADFFSSMERASGQKLTRWVNQWLNKASLNTVQVDFSCKNGKVDFAQLIQSAPKGYPTIREHKTLIALFNINGKKAYKNKVISFSYDQEKNPIKEMLGQKCPDLVYPNYEDYDFAKVQLDPISIQTIKEHISKVQDKLTKSMLYQSLWDMVRDAQLSLNEYSKIIMNNIFKEKDFKIFSKNVQKLSGNYGSNVYSYYYIKAQYEHSYRNKLNMISNFFQNNINRFKPGSDRQKIWFRSFLSIAHGDKAINQLKKWLKENKGPRGIKLVNEYRWKIIYRLNSLNVPKSLELITEELEMDKTDYARKWSIASEVIRPNTIVKKKWYDKIRKDDQSKLSLLKPAMRNFYRSESIKFKNMFATSFKDDLEMVLKKKDHIYQRFFARSMAPTLCHEKSVKNLTRLISDFEYAPLGIRKSLKVSKQEDERCVKIISKL